MTVRASKTLAPGARSVPRPSLRRFARDDEGSGMVEFAVVLPIVLTILFAVIEFSYAMMVDRKVTNTTQALADLVAQFESFNTEAQTEIQTAAAIMMRPLPPDYTVSVVHVPYRTDDDTPDMTLDEAWGRQYFAGDPIANDDAEAAAAGLGFGGEAVVIVDFTYDYDSVTGGLFTSLLSLLGTDGRNWEGVTFYKRMVSRPRRVRQIPCTIC